MPARDTRQGALVRSLIAVRVPRVWPTSSTRAGEGVPTSFALRENFSSRSRSSIMSKNCRSRLALGYDTHGYVKRGSTMPSQKPRILLVEDEPLIALFVEELLNDLNCECVGPIKDLPNALHYASNGSFEAAILNLVIDGKNAYSVAEALAGREIPWHRLGRVCRTGHLKLNGKIVRICPSLTGLRISGC